MAEIFADRYEIDREVGRGGFGVVYLAHDNRLRRRAVALKVVHPALSTDPAVVRLFQEEAGILASLAHDHIVPVYDAGVWEGRRYIVMQYLEGRSLAQVVADEGAQPAERGRAWLRQAASALAHAHEQGVLHRDVKSANLLLDRTGGRLYVTDFGLAQAVQASGGSSLSQAGALTGTAAYRAPEVAKTGHTAASDLYGLGVVAYELLAGRLPFLADDPLSMLMLHATEPVPPLPANVPPDLAALVGRLLAKDPAARPASAAELLALLAEPAGQPGPAEARPAPGQSPLQEAAAPEVIPEPQRPQPGQSPLQEAAAPEAAPEPQRPQPGPKPARRPLPVAAGLIILAVLAGVIWALTRPPQPPAVARATSTLGIGSTWTSPADGMVQVYVPAGEFLMGSADDDSDADSDEKPQHQVTLDAYWIDRTEVTNAMFARFVAASGYKTDAEKAGTGYVYNSTSKDWEETAGVYWQRPRGSGSGLAGLDAHPVVVVSWNDAAAYCAWAGRRLPTEAEWEKAARGTDGRIYPWGNQAPDNTHLNFILRPGHTTAVGAYPSGASPYGALDMAGNVYEWAADWYGDTYYAGSPTANPKGPDSGQYRVLRGGSFDSLEQFVRAAYRDRSEPGIGIVSLGFRCARSN